MWQALFYLTFPAPMGLGPLQRTNKPKLKGLRDRSFIWSNIWDNEELSNARYFCLKFEIRHLIDTSSRLALLQICHKTNVSLLASSSFTQLQVHFILPNHNSIYSKSYIPTISLHVLSNTSFDEPPLGPLSPQLNDSPDLIILPSPLNLHYSVVLTSPHLTSEVNSSGDQSVMCDADTPFRSPTCVNPITWTSSSSSSVSYVTMCTFDMSLLLCLWGSKLPETQQCSLWSTHSNVAE